jgi:uncharacterized protein YjbI with pentapeptide repeats
MANLEHLEILKQGVDVWKKWREENPDVEPDLIKADLSGLDLRSAFLWGANLTKANLSRSDLSRTNFIKANLNEANLSEAQLLWAKFSEADRLLNERYVQIHPVLQKIVLAVQTAIR